MGTRRKARECALQILFAADVAQAPKSVLMHDYWEGFGFDEIVKGANLLISSFLDEITRIETFVKEFKAIAKKVRNISNSREHLSAENILNLTERVRKNYREFIKEFIIGEIPQVEIIEENTFFRMPQLEALSETITKIENNFNQLILNLLFEINKHSKYLTENEDKSVKDLKDASQQVFNNLTNSVIPKIKLMIEEIHPTREFTNKLALTTLNELETVDERIRSRAEHWRIERMAIVDRNVLRLAVYEFLFEPTPHTVVINEALEIARRFSTFEATQFINGILDAIKHDLEKDQSSEKKNNGDKNQKIKASSL